MQNDSLYQNSVISRIITPYRKLRDYNRLKADYVASVLGVSVASLHRYEAGGAPIPKQTIIKLDRLYGCNGKLISYWLTDKMSAAYNVTARNENKKRANFRIIIEILS